jgi:hypothetical protein
MKFAPDIKLQFHDGKRLVINKSEAKFLIYSKEKQRFIQNKNQAKEWKNVEITL